MAFGSQNLGEAVLDLRADQGPLRKDLAAAERTTGRTMAGIQRKTDRAAKVAGVALLGIGAAAWKATGAASDLSESINKSRQTFGKAAEEMPGMGEAVAESLGLTRAEALEAAASIGSMLIPMGSSQDEAAKMSDRMVTLAADLGSFHNADPTEMLDRLRAGLSGESEPLKRFGIVLSEARVQTEAYRTGIAEVGEQLTDAQKVQARYSLAIRDAGKANGDFARTADGLANQQRILKAQVGDLAASFGSVLLPAANLVVGGLRDVAGWVDRNRTTATVLIGVVGGLAAGIVAVNLAARGYAATTAAVNAVQGLFVTRTAAATGATVAQTGAQRGLNVAMRANPVGIVITAVALLAAGFVTAYQRSETFRDVVRAAMRPVTGAVELVVEAIAGIVTGIEAVIGVGRDVKAFFDSLSGGSRTTAEEVGGALKEIHADARRTQAVTTTAARRFVDDHGTMQEAVRGTSDVTKAFGDTADTIAKTVVGKWGKAADNMILDLATKRADAEAAGSGIGSSYITGVVSGIQANQAVVNAAFGSSVSQAAAAGRARARAQSPSRLTAELVGRPLAEGVAAGIKERAPAVATALSGAVVQAIRDARGNLSTLAGGLASSIAQAIDARMGARLAPLDEATGAEAAELRAMEDALRARQQAAERARLGGAISEAASGVVTGEEGARERLAEAHAQLADWEAQRAIEAERERLDGVRAAVMAEEEARKASAERQLADLADALNRGLIKQAAFSEGVAAVLRDADVSVASAGEYLGTAFAEAFRAQLRSLTQQVARLGDVPHVGGGAGGPLVADPFTVRMEEWRERERTLRDALAAAKAAKPPEGSPQRRWDAYRSAVQGSNARLIAHQANRPRRLAEGAILTSPTFGLLAEAGVPELALPLDGSRRSWGLLERAEETMARRQGAPAPGGPLVNVEAMQVRAPEDASLVAHRLSRYLAVKGVRP